MVVEGETSQNTMSGRKLAPPIFSKEVNYKVWKNKLEMWKIVCGIPIKEQGIIVLLQSLVDNKKAEKAVSTLTAHDLNGDSGLEKRKMHFTHTKENIIDSIKINTIRI